jgi:hypothetical protein
MKNFSTENYFFQNNSQRIKICQIALLNFLCIAKSRLRCKIQNNRNISEDFRGKHESRPHKSYFLLNEDLKEFFNSLPTEISHYGQNKKNKYIASEFGSISNIHRLFLDLLPEHKTDCSYSLFFKEFNKSGIFLKKPNKDLCETCEQFKYEIFKLKRIQNLKPIKNLMIQFHV